MFARVAELTQNALFLALLVSLPALIASFGTALLGGLLGRSLQLHDSSLQQVPRILAVLAAVLLFGTWGASLLLRYTSDLWRAIPTLVR